MNDFERVAAVIRHIDAHHETQPSLRELAAAAGLSESHFHRLFRRWAGVTPKDFLQCLTAEHAKRRLRESASVMAAALDTGLSGPGRLHDLLVTIEAASPGEYKSGGVGMTIGWGETASPFGKCCVAWNDRGICHLAFDEDGEPGSIPASLRANWPNAEFRRNNREAGRWAKVIFQAATSSDAAEPPEAFLPPPSPPSGEKAGMRGRLQPSNALPLRAFVRGTPFQLKVWRALLRVPEGCLTTYGALAASIGDSQAARAVGSACGSNSIAWLIPCHRVIRETGVVKGYRWGDTRKRAMLAWESAS